MASYADILFGKIALANRLLTPAQLNQALAAQGSATLADSLVQRGVLTREQAARVHKAQALAQFMRAEKIFARIVLERRLADTNTLRECFARQEQAQHRVRLGQMLIERRLLNPEQAESIVEEQLVRLADDTARIEEGGLSSDMGDSDPVNKSLGQGGIERTMEMVAPSSAPPAAERTMAMAPPPGALTRPGGPPIASSPPSGPGDELVGKTIASRYRILAKVGEGGMGTVYKAEHCLMEKVVALKVLHASLVSSKQSLERFRREIRAASKFQHKNVIQIYDAGEGENGIFYMTMEFAEGETLEDVLKRQGALPVDRCARILRQVLGAIGDAHRKGIVHRDLKSGNVMIVRGKEGEDLVKVMDFGIAKISLESGEGADSNVAGLYRTQEGVVTGTPQYMSPEQCSGESVDGRADLYSLGVILFEVLTGELPFKSNTPMGFLGKHIVEPPPAPSSLRAGIPRLLEDVTLRLLEKKPEARFQTAEEILAYLDQAALAGSARGGHRPTVASPGPALNLTVEIAAPTDVEAAGAVAASHARSGALTGSASGALSSPGTLVAPAPAPAAAPPAPARSPVLAIALVLMLLLVASVSTTLALVFSQGPGKTTEPAPPTDTAAVTPPPPPTEPPPPRTEPPPPRTEPPPPRTEPPPPPPPTEPPPPDPLAEGRELLGKLDLALRAGNVSEAEALLAQATPLFSSNHTDLELAGRSVRSARKAEDAREARKGGDPRRAAALLSEAIDLQPDRQVQNQLREELDVVEDEVRTADAVTVRRTLEAARDAALQKSLEAAVALDVDGARAALEAARQAARKLGDEGPTRARARSLETLATMSGPLRAIEEQVKGVVEPAAGAPPTTAKVQAVLTRLEELRAGLSALAADEPLASGLHARLTDHLGRAQTVLAGLQRPVEATEEERTLALFQRMLDRVREGLAVSGRETAALVEDRLKKLQPLLENRAYSRSKCAPEDKRWIDERVSFYQARRAVWDDLGPRMSAIPGGAWRSPAGAEVKLPEPYYYAGDAEVTCAEWDVFMRATTRPRPPEFPGPTDEPVRMISFAEAKAYCAWRSRRPDGKPRKVEFRLPTAAEWERAARAEAGTEFPWGAAFEDWRLPDHAAMRGISRVRAFRKDRNAFDLYDLVGNVQEMTSTLREGKVVVKGGSLASAPAASGAGAVSLVAERDLASRSIGLRVFAHERPASR